MSESGVKLTTDQGSGLRDTTIFEENVEPQSRSFSLEERNRVTAKMKGEKGLSEKEIKLYERADPKDTAEYLEIWQKFKKVGLPVVPTVRKSEEGALYMTDLTADGSQIYGKNAMLQADFLSRRGGDYELTDIDKIFLEQMTGDGFNQILKKIHKIADLATENGIVLPVDDPFELLIHPDGSWEIIIIDLKLAKLDEPEDKARLINNDNIVLYLDVLEALSILYKKFQDKPKGVA